MRVLFLSIMLLLVAAAAQADFIHPLDFNGSEDQKSQVIDYIKERVKKDYCETVDMCQDVMLRLMEEQNLEAFKHLTKATEREILDRAIKDYCETVDMCSYQMIDMMYKENMKASKKELTW